MRIGSCPECTNSFFPPKHILQLSEQKTIQAVCLRPLAKKKKKLWKGGQFYFKSFQKKYKFSLFFFPLFYVWSLNVRLIPDTFLSLLVSGRIWASLSLTSHIFFTLDKYQLDKEVAGKTEARAFLLNGQINRHSLDPHPTLLHVNFIYHTRDRLAFGGSVIPVITH